MYKITNNKIKLTRGDTLNVNVTMLNSEGEEYLPNNGDVITFALKKDPTDENTLIEKEVLSGVLHLDPSDTADLEFGNYFYDISITFNNGDVYTFIPKTSFMIMEEIG